MTHLPYLFLSCVVKYRKINHKLNHGRVFGIFTYGIIGCYGLATGLGPIPGLELDKLLSRVPCDEDKDIAFGGTLTPKKVKVNAVVQHNKNGAFWRFCAKEQSPILPMKWACSFLKRFVWPFSLLNGPSKGSNSANEQTVLPIERTIFLTKRPTMSTNQIMSKICRCGSSAVIEMIESRNSTHI